jgi:hypothetical protein
LGTDWLTSLRVALAVDIDRTSFGEYPKLPSVALSAGRKNVGCRGGQIGNRVSHNPTTGLPGNVFQLDLRCKPLEGTRDVFVDLLCGGIYCQDCTRLEGDSMRPQVEVPYG